MTLRVEEWSDAGEQGGWTMRLGGRGCSSTRACLGEWEVWAASQVVMSSKHGSLDCAGGEVILTKYPHHEPINEGEGEEDAEAGVERHVNDAEPDGKQAFHAQHLDEVLVQVPQDVGQLVVPEPRVARRPYDLLHGGKHE